MNTIPDDPMIRNAEMYGPPDADTVYCPICGEECLEIYSDMFDNVFACENCLQMQDANQWAIDEKERNEPDG